MSDFVSFGDLSRPAFSSGEVVHALTDQAEIFLFCFAPDAKMLLSWSKNSLPVLGMPDFAIARNADVFLRAVHGDDRFDLLNTLERAFESKSGIREVYRWVRPDNGEIRWLLCRAAPVMREGEIVFDGMITDVTEEVTRFGGDIRHYRLALHCLDTRVIALDGENRITFSTFRPEDTTLGNFDDPDFDHSVLSRVGRELFSGFRDKRARSRLLTAVNRVLEGSADYSTEHYHFGDRVTTVELHPALHNGAVTGVILLIRDATERAVLESEVTELRKLRSSVDLVAQYITYAESAWQKILGLAQSIESNQLGAEGTKECSRQISEIAHAAFSLAHAIVPFQPVPANSSCNLNIILIEVLKKLEDLRLSGIIISISFSPRATVDGNENVLVRALEGLTRAMIKENACRSVTISVELPSSSPGVVAVLFEGAGSHPRVSNAQEDRSPASFEPHIQTIRSERGEVIHEAGATGGRKLTVYLPLATRNATPLTAPHYSGSVVLVANRSDYFEAVSVLLRGSGLTPIFATSLASLQRLLRGHTPPVQAAVVDVEFVGERTERFLRTLTPEKSPVPVCLINAGTYRGRSEDLRQRGAGKIFKRRPQPSGMVSALCTILAGRMKDSHSQDRR